MVPTYIVLVVVLCGAVTSEARLFIGDCSYGFCEQECKQYERLQMECFCRRGFVLKADGRKCLKTDDTEEDLAASGDEGSGKDIEVSNCDNEDGDCDKTLILVDYSGNGDENEVEEGGSGDTSSEREKIKIVSPLLPDETVFDPLLDNIPYIISFSFDYPRAKCISKLDADPYEFRNIMRNQIVSSTFMDDKSVREFKISCSSIVIRFKLLKTSKLSVKNAVKKIRDRVTNGKLSITIDGQVVKALRRSFKSIRDPSYPITAKVIPKRIEIPVPVITTSTTKVKTTTTELDKIQTSLTEVTQTLTKSYPRAEQTPVHSTSEYLVSTLIPTRSTDAKTASPASSSIQTLLSIIESEDIVQGFVTSTVNITTQTFTTPSTMRFETTTSHGVFAGQTSARASLSSLKSLPTTVQEIPPSLKPSSTSGLKSLSSSARVVSSIKTSTSQIKERSHSSPQPLETVGLLYTKVTKKTTSVPRTTSVPSTSTEYRQTYTRTDSTSQKVMPQQSTVKKTGMSTTSTFLTGIGHSSRMVIVSSVTDGTSTMATNMATKTPLATVAKHVATTSSTIHLNPKETSSFKTTMGTSSVGIKIGPGFVSTSTTSSVSDIVQSSQIKLEDKITSSRTTSVVSSTQSRLTSHHPPVVIVSSSFAPKKTTELHKITIQSSKPAVLSTTVQSSYKKEIKSSPSTVASETEPVIKVIVLKTYDGKGSRGCRLLPDSHVLLILTSFLTYLLVLR